MLGMPPSMCARLQAPSATESVAGSPKGGAVRGRGQEASPASAVGLDPRMVLTAIQKAPHCFRVVPDVYEVTMNSALGTHWQWT